MSKTQAEETVRSFLTKLREELGEDKFQKVCKDFVENQPKMDVDIDPTALLAGVGLGFIRSMVPEAIQPRAPEMFFTCPANKLVQNIQREMRRQMLIESGAQLIERLAGALLYRRTPRKDG